MNTQAKLNLLQEWQETIENAGKILGQLDAVVGRTDGPLRDSFYRMEAVYTKAIGMCVGDMDNWLEWYACDNDMGRKGLSAKAKPGVPMKKIKTLPALLKLIEATRAN